MKRYLTTFFIILSMFIIIIGLRFDFRWNGIVSWGLSFVSLLFAAYFTKYIPNREKENRNNS